MILTKIITGIAFVVIFIVALAVATACRADDTQPTPPYNYNMLPIGEIPKIPYAIEEGAEGWQEVYHNSFVYVASDTVIAIVYHQVFVGWKWTAYFYQGFSPYYFYGTVRNKYAAFWAVEDIFKKKYWM